MGTITVASIINKAAILILDADGVRWPDEEMLGWFNDGQREAVIFKPNAFVKNTNIALVAGTKQRLPDDCNTLFELVRNTGADGNTPGMGISIVDRRLLDAQSPDWHLGKGAKAVVRHYTYNPLDPKTFYVYPASPGGVFVEAAYSAVPPAVSKTGVIGLDDIYAGALLNYLLYRAYSKDTEFAANAASADRFYQAFLLNLNGKTGGDAGAPRSGQS